MDHFSMRVFPQYEHPPHHDMLFEMLDRIIKEGTALSYPFYLQVAYHILSNMESIFIERRGRAFFHFLFTNLCNQTDLLEQQQSPCVATPFLHEVDFLFQKKQVMGLFVKLHGAHIEIENIKQSFLDHHKEILPIEHATLPFLHLKQNQTMLYFEVQKKEGNFTPDDADDFKEHLEEIATLYISKWKTPIPLLESSFKTLRWLMSEIKEGDIPHALIDLGEQKPDGLSFFVLLCKRSSPDHNPFAKLLAHPNIEEKLRLREENKAGIVMKIDLLHAPTLSLIGGRQKISALLKELIGDFRDVNGGLLELIEKNFVDLSQSLPNSNYFLREFFDAILPEDLRATSDPSMLKEIYLATQKKMQSQLNMDYTLLKNDKWIAAIVKIDKGFEKDWRNTLSNLLTRVGFSQISLPRKTILIAFLPVPNDEEKELFKKETKNLFQQWNQRKTSKQILRLCTTYRFTSFDPRTGSEEEACYLHKLLFEGLMRIGPSGKAEPAIAKKVSISKDGKHYRFTLRKSQWSNGIPLTAHDFLYSWQMTLKRKDLAPLSYLFDCIEHAQEIKEGKMCLDALGVEAVDDDTLEVKLLGPCIPFLEICSLSLFSPICRTIDEKHPSWAETEGNEYVCNGPFYLEKKEANGGVILKKNPLHWEADKVRLEQVTIPFVSQEEGKTLFLNKQVDALLYYFYQKPNTIPLGDLEVKHLKGAINTRYLCFNCLKPPFHNKKVRKAIALAIDKQKIAEAFSKDAIPSYSFGFPFEFQNKQVKGDSHLQNIHKARELILQALAEDPNVYKNIFNSNFAITEKREDFGKFFCNYINEMLNLNWNLSIIKNANTKEYYDKKENFQIAFFAWTNRIYDPGYFFESFSNPDNFANLSYWTHPLIQSLLKKSKYAKTHKERKRFFELIENLLMEETPMIPLFSTRCQSLHYHHVQGIYANDLPPFDIRFAFKQ